jgi:hypothetical protein
VKTNSSAHYKLVFVLVTDLHNIQTRSGALSISCIVGTQGCFPRGKIAEGIKLITHIANAEVNVGTIPQHPCTSLMCDASSLIISVGDYTVAFP